MITCTGRQNKGFKKQIGDWAKRTGLEHNRNLLNNPDCGANNGGGGIKYRLANAVVFQKVKAVLGLNKCERFFCAAAPVSKEILEYFLSLDIRILDIYGMSEVSGPQLSNTYENRKLGSIGKQLDGFWHKLSPLDGAPATREEGSKRGELCARGRHVMMGYLFNREKTDEVFDKEGWLHSGDVGEEDVEGFVSITGRIKELIITAGGENVPPVLIEDAIKAQLPEIVSNAVLVGDRRKFLACLLTLRSEIDQDTTQPLDALAPEAKAWCEAAGSKAVTVEEAAKDEAVAKGIQEGIDRANSMATSNAQRVQKWIILPQDFSVPGGELGPTLKIKRHVVMEKNVAAVDGLYK